jgi:hypothetical protein
MEDGTTGYDRIIARLRALYLAELRNISNPELTDDDDKDARHGADLLYVAMDIVRREQDASFERLVASINEPEHVCA